MHIPVVSRRNISYALSGVLAIISVILIFSGTLNYGIDMTGGTQGAYEYSDYTYDNDAIRDVAVAVSRKVDESGKIINSINTYKISGEESFIVETGFTRSLDEKELDAYKIQYRDELTKAYENLGNIQLLQYTNIGASFGDYIRSTARLTLILAIIAIALYIAYSFSGAVGGISSWGFAGITIVTLFHDVLIASGIYILISKFFHQYQIDTFFITALLTILGYSINDTIVIFDRIRSNLKEFGGKGKALEEIISLSIDETMTRSIYTSLTLVLVLICMLIWGPVSIDGFTLAMLLGTIVGTYSSIFIAAPLLYDLNKNKILTEYKKKEPRSAEEKMVV